MKIIEYIFDNLNKAFVFALLIFLIWLIPAIVLRVGYTIGLAVSVAPLAFLLVLTLLDKPYLSFLMLFSINYFVSGATRYISYPPGIAMDVVFLLVLIVFVLQSFRSHSQVKLADAANPLTGLAFAWLVYCLFQFFNPGLSSPIAWLINVRGIGIYFFLVVTLGAMYMRKYKNLKQIMNLWAVFCLIAVLKAFIQETFGFDPFEQRWLAAGGARTHIIHTGIRYFSIFTDAGNFGSGIALSSVAFAIAAFHYKTEKIKYFYFFVAAACAYGMIISGTRGSLVIPFSGLTLYTVLSKNVRAIVITFLFLGIGFWFLNFTYIGNGNIYIRRMRSAFNPDDASLGVRLENQAILRTYMAGRPLGVGIGMKRGNAELYVPHPVLSKIPHDSWYVLLWVELGIVGMIFYIFILLYILAYGGFLVMFVLKDTELRGIVAGLVCALFGVSVAAYSLEIFGQFPNSIIIYVCMTLIFLSPMYDRELEEEQKKKLLENR